MTKIDEIIYNLQLVSDVIPNYSEGRNQGLSDDDIENLALNGVHQAIKFLIDLQENCK